MNNLESGDSSREGAAAQAARARKPSLVRFGIFELNLNTGELHRQGVRTNLQRKSFQILEALLERPGEVVTRECLIGRLWQDDTHVDFENGLNTAVNRLRVVLNDSADTPIYVETLSRIGYRFIAPVEYLPSVSVTLPDRETGPAIQPTGAVTDEEPSRHAFKRPLILTAWVCAAVALLLGAFFLRGFLVASHPPPSFRRITFSSTFAGNARFTKDRRAVVYTGNSHNRTRGLFQTDLDKLETTDLKLGSASLAALSSSNLAFFSCAGDSNCSTLEVKPLSSGPTAKLAPNVRGVDFGPGGKAALVRESNGLSWLEYPASHNVYTAHGWIGNVRVSPDGKRVAFAEHPTLNDDAGQIVVVEAQGKAQAISSGWASVSGLAWHPVLNEVWFTGARFGTDRALMAVNKSGRLRQVAELPGGMILYDINARGNVLIAKPNSRVSMFRGNLRDGTVLDISWLDWSRATALSANGRLVLFDESGQGGGSRYSTYLYDADKHTSRRLGDGRSLNLSPDGRWALTQSAENSTRVQMVSVQDGRVKPVNTDGLDYTWAKFIPGSDCQEILLAASRPGKRSRLYRQHLPDQAPQVIVSAPYMTDAWIDRYAEIALGLDENMNFSVLDLKNGTARPLSNPDFVWPVGFAGRHSLLTRRSLDGRLLIEHLNLDTAKRELAGEVALPKTDDAMEIESMHFADDLQTYVYSSFRSTSTLFIVSGWG